MAVLQNIKIENKFIGYEIGDKSKSAVIVI